MNTLESIAQTMGKGDKLNNPIWNSFKNKNPEEVIPHAMNTVKGMGIESKILNFFGGSK